MLLLCARYAATAALRCAALAALTVLLAGLLIAAQYALEVRSELQSGGMSTHCVLHACLLIAPDTVTLWWGT